MTQDLILRDLILGFAPDKALLRNFLLRHHLRLEEDIDYAVGLFEGDRLCACGCAADGLLKCFAVSEELRGQNALGRLVNALVQNRAGQGIFSLFAITRLPNKALFVGCGFWPVAQTDTVVLLENLPKGPERFAHRLLGTAQPEPSGAIVMNCNPFTLGHRALIESASARCPLLRIFVVEEDRSDFPFAARLRLVQEGVADLPNVLVYPSGPYMISAATFPTYFLKENEDAAQIQSELDITLFASRLAPAFGITARFAGEEPLDPVTERYNAAMRRILPRHGIEFVEIPRVQAGGNCISASRVRRLLREQGGFCDELLELVPSSTAAWLKNEYRAPSSEKPHGRV